MTLHSVTKCKNHFLNKVMAALANATTDAVNRTPQRDTVQEAKQRKEFDYHMTHRTSTKLTPFFCVPPTKRNKDADKVIQRIEFVRVDTTLQIGVR